MKNSDSTGKQLDFTWFYHQNMWFYHRKLDSLGPAGISAPTVIAVCPRCNPKKFTTWDLTSKNKDLTIQEFHFTTKKADSTIKQNALRGTHLDLTSKHEGLGS